MKRTVHVTPGGLTALQAKIGIAVAIFFLLFGLLFAFVVGMETPESETGLRLLQAGFLLLWIVGCISMIVMYVRLLSAHKKPQDSSLLDLHLGAASADTPVQGGDFADRLRKLEALKADGLVSESEYHSKRKEILQEKW